MKYDYLFGWPHPIIAVIIISSSVRLHFLSSLTHINCFVCFIVVFSVSTNDHQDACSWVIKVKSGAINIQHSRKPTITLESSYRKHLVNRCNNSAGRLRVTTASHLRRAGFQQLLQELIKYSPTVNKHQVATSQPSWIRIFRIMGFYGILSCFSRNGKFVFHNSDFVSQKCKFISCLHRKVRIVTKTLAVFICELI